MITENWQWWAGDNDERYCTGPCASREEAIAEAIDTDVGYDETPDGPVNHLHLCEALMFPPVRFAEYLDFELVTERADEKACDRGLVDPEGDQTFFAANADHYKDLEDRLKQACDEWQKAHGIVFRSLQFQKTRNLEQGTFVKVAPRTEPATPFKLLVLE